MHDRKLNRYKYVNKILQQQNVLTNQKRLEVTRMKKMKFTKGKLAALVAAGCMVIALPVMAFNASYPYEVQNYNSMYLTGIRTQYSTVYLNTRPNTGGDVKIRLEGAANTSATFPYRTSRDDWAVAITPNEQLRIYAVSISTNTTKGILHVWD